MERDTVFWFCALSGSGLFLIQFLLNLIGSNGEGEISDLQFKWLSKQAIAAFLMMFGWMGLASLKELGLGTLPSTGIALASGIGAVGVFGSIMKGARKLKSEGTVFRLEEAIGKKGSVYQRIPSNGSGKITIVIGGFTHEIDAVSLDRSELASFTSVEVVEKMDERTLVVIPTK